MLIALPSAASATEFKTLYEALAAHGEYDPEADTFKPALQAKAELDRFSWLVGDWRQKASLYPIGVVRAVTSDMGVWTFTIDHESNAIRYAAKGGKDQLLFMAYDPYTRVWYAAEQAFEAWGTARSSGAWSSDKVVLEGVVTVRGVEMTLRQTFARVKPDVCAVVNEQRLPDGSWVKVDEHRFFRERAK